MKKILISFFLMLLTNCSHLPTSPDPVIESPELKGSRGFSFQAGFQGKYQAEEPPNNATENKSTINKLTDSVINPRALYSPISKLSVGLDLFALSGLGAAIVSQYQIWGEGYQKPKKGNFSLLVHSRIGSSFNFEGTNSWWFGTNGDPDGSDDYSISCSNGRGTANFLQGGVSAGYRVNNALMMYSGISLGHTWNKSKYDKDLGDPNCPVMTYNNYSKQRTYGLGALVRLARFLQLNTGIDITERFFSDRESIIDPSLRAAALFYF